MLTSSFSLLSNATDKPRFLKERIMESFIFPTLDHASPTYFVIRTLRWLAFTINMLIEVFIQVIFKQRTYFIFKRFICQYVDNWTRDVHPDGTLTREFLCFFKSSFTVSVCCARWTSAMRIFPSEFCPIGFVRICPFGRNPFPHNLLITPSLFLIHDLHSSGITLYFFNTYSKTFASKNNSLSYSVNPISKYCQLDSRFSLV